MGFLFLLKSQNLILIIMAKELPYFQFEPAEYLTKDVSFCSLSAQGLFINICSYYWQRQCDLSKEQFLRRFNYPIEFEELLKEGVIDVVENKIVVKFLNNQYLKATEKSTVNSSNGSKGGRPKKPIETEIKPNEKPIESEPKGIREEKIIEEEIKQINIEFFNEFSTSDYWLEGNAMKNRITVLKTKEYLKRFHNDLFLCKDKKNNSTEYASHFTRWLPLEIEKDKSKQPPKTSLGI